ncbi:5'-methylthioadenosine/S-adenosylhomocysteine nucleosidase [Polyangium sp. y55x31]|uniref:5'-methylthioadenosine/S-adenosylhomocysteine nucleosidase family protein n=1 Tax=Polyangium sp. y55x31 TaxID=3042688 RepID=UPI002482DAC1|nr:5'-methylthioadenosine/S-adenosylhomocysteine nucleosidase [Polyangium sp. y55x31]MDI1483608.1 5'-methylthioadenosine/S-adenosylhomocysteine nucleosidase [Polyangium sp. y55x31]
MSIDFVILTALQVERTAVCGALGFTDEHSVPQGVRNYWRGRLELPGGGAYEIAVAQALDMASVDAALLANDAFHHWNPQGALFVGIAGSADPSVKPGDVVAASEVHYFERGKAVPGGKRPEPKIVNADARLLGRCQAISWSGSVPVEPPESTERPPRVHCGVIASVEKVIGDEDAKREILAGNRKVLAIEMEGYGFSRAAWQSDERVRHLVIRAISDAADALKSDAWHAHAAASAAAFAKHLLLARPLEPRPSGSTSALPP